ncbi:hypothetical protein K461DRAFT_44104 [Myriangium duriaei CBS 260.36]|uniref:Coiled-coil domain-containing protein 16 n=1 Tax=Myriangium duriaei CBS 260.36 TaxID=1168546 RepID=A0A9P4IWU0_9PEZI|nr:hypothetical protein K461DRAFT_44104 [Myriangium duriaei CBS 260.36]
MQTTLLQSSPSSANGANILQNRTSLSSNLPPLSYLERAHHDNSLTTMSDARSLLASARASQRITHPHARYSESGKLTCTLCDTLVKPESAWKTHLRTPDHARRALRAAEAAAKQNGNPRKRKADSEEDEDDDSRKRVREDDEDVDDAPAEKTVRFAPDTKDSSPADSPAPPAVEDAPTIAPSTDSPAPAVATADDDDPEWLELQRIIRETNDDSTTLEGATISAPAMTAAEVAAQAREEQSSQKERRQAEIDDEKEDAAQAMEAEFDEMEGLEERVRSLRERREALRAVENSADATGMKGGDVNGFMTDRTKSDHAGSEAVEKHDSNGHAADEHGGVESAAEVADEDDDDDEDEEDDDVWNFGAD